jgi:hypothetical protein
VMEFPRGRILRATGVLIGRPATVLSCLGTGVASETVKNMSNRNRDQET